MFSIIAGRGFVHAGASRAMAPSFGGADGSAGQLACSLLMFSIYIVGNARSRTANNGAAFLR